MAFPHDADNAVAPSPRETPTHDGTRRKAAADGDGRDIAGVDFARGLEINGNNEETYWDALATFVESTPQTLDKMRLDAAEGNLDDLQILAHGVKGSGRMVGVQVVADLAEQVEFAAQRRDLDSARRCVAALLPKAAGLIARIETASMRHAMAHPRRARTEPDADVLADLLQAVQALDIDGMDVAMAELGAYNYETGASLVRWLEDQVGGDMELDAMVERLTAALARRGAPRRRKRAEKAVDGRPVIFLVDDQQVNLVAGKNILKGRYRVYPIRRSPVMFEFLRRIVPDLILLDVKMPGLDGFEAIRRLKANDAWASIPVIFLTAKNEVDSEIRGLALGAADYVLKPFSPPLLIQRIETHLALAWRQKQLVEFNQNLEGMVRARTQMILNVQNALLHTMSRLVEYRDDVTGGHVTRTQRLFDLMLERMAACGLHDDVTKGWDRDHILLSVPLHDVGKIAISDLILKKPGKLTPDEFDIMKTHASIGADIIAGVESETGEKHGFFTHARLIAGTHHEKWDGSGYPDGISGAMIPLEGRIMALVDVYDALISVRPYKAAMPPEKALDIIREGRGTHFDPALVDLFSASVDAFVHVAQTGAQI
ncbi:MAG: response regulator [Acidobacteriota bacterium]|nr:response regulator [Acidobacteriota bacterium]